ncbi:MAG: DUF1801 domain-containing protein [Flavobacteriaceae bacterium]|nr:DUF1801 domain-containing protein [Flavobacteriaceae bacterium]
MNPVDNYFLNLNEPERSLLLLLRDLILKTDENITLGWAFQMPFFYYKKKMFCYIRIEKKSGMPYLAFAKGKFMQHPHLESGDRKLFKILYLNTQEDLDNNLVKNLLHEAISYY